MTTLLGDARIRIRPDTTGFDSDLNRSVGGSFKKVAALAAGALATIGVGAAIKSIGQIGMTYEDTMLNLQAVSKATASQMAAVGETAKKLGADTSLTATSAADAAIAMTELAKGGLSVEEAMSAAKGTLQLAAAAGVEAGQAAEIQAAALNAFNLEADQSGRVADVLANAANAAAGEITDFAWALQAGGAVAAAAGISIEDTSAALGILANNGIKGSDAGTLLKSALLALQSPSAAAQDAMDALGLSAYDANGEFVGMESLFEQLQVASEKMTDQQYAQATSTLFGSDAARLAGIAGREGGEGFAVMAEAMSQSGSAADVASAKAAGLSGAIEAFKSNVETVAIDLYEKFSPAVEEAVRGATAAFTGLVDWVSNDFIPGLAATWTSLSETFDFPSLFDGVSTAWNEIDLDFGAIFTGIKDAAIAAGSELLDGISTGIDTGDWGPLGESIIGILGDALSRVGELAGKAYLAIADLFGKVDWVGLGLEIGKQVPTLLAGLALGILNFDLGGLLQGLKDHWFEVLMGILAIALAPARIIGKVGELLTKIPLVGKFLAWMLNAIRGLTDKIGGWISDIVGGFVRGFIGEGTKIGAAFRTIWDNIATYLYVWGDDIIKWFRGLPGKFAEIAENLGAWLRTKFDEIATFMGEAIKRGANAAIEFFRNLGVRAGELMGGMKDTVVRLADDARQFVSDKFGALRDKAVEIFIGAKDRVTSVFGDMIRPLKDGATDAWSWVTTKFTDLKNGAVRIFTDLKNTVGNIWGSVLDVVKQPVRTVLDFVNDKIIDNVNKVTSKFGLDIPRIRYSFATGGVVPGLATPGRDNHIAAVGSGEAIMRSEFTNAVGANGINALNQAARIGGTAGVKQLLANGGLGFASGGIMPKDSGGPLSWISDKVTDGINWAKDGVENLLAKGASFALKALIEPAAGWITKNIDNPLVSKLVSGAMKQLTSKAAEWGTTKDNEAAVNDGGIAGAGGGGAIGGGWTSIFNSVKGAFPQARANSTVRPGDPGYHGRGKAVDLGQIGRSGGMGHPYLAAMHRWLYDNYGGKLAELIYYGAGVDRPSVKNGRNHTYNLGTQRGHFNHVHAAVYDKGGILPPGMTIANNKSGKPEGILTNKQLLWLREAANGTTEAPLIGGDFILQTAPGASAHDQMEEAMFQLRRIKRGGRIR